MSENLCEQDIAPKAARRYAPSPPTAVQSKNRGGSKSVRGQVHSPHISGGRPAAGSQRAYSLGGTDGRIAVSLNAPYGGGNNNRHG